MKALGVVLVLLAAGCVTNSAGDSEVDRQECLAIVEQAQAAVIACEFITGDDAEEVALNKERCRTSGEIAVIAARLGCSFAPDVQ